MMAVDERRAEWERIQEQLRSQLVAHDLFDAKIFDPSTPDDLFSSRSRPLIGGVDISFVKDDDNTACACLVVLSFPDLEIVYSQQRSVAVTTPYIAGYLAFREVPVLVELIDELREIRPDLIPQVILVDGNGILHSKGFGSACHLGVLSGIPTIGVAKNLLYIDGLDKKFVRDRQSLLDKAGNWFPLQGASGRVWGAALKTTHDSYNPVYVSVGYGVSLETATTIVSKCCIHRVPEPIRKADHLSREWLRQNKS